MKTKKSTFQLFLILALVVCSASAAAAQALSIKLTVDATQAARNILHSKFTIPVRPGPLTLFYPKWIPGEHSPTGPINDLVGLKLSANGKPVAWQRDDVEMFAFHCEVPQGADELEVSFDDVSQPETTASAKLARIKWNRLILYPREMNSDTIRVRASLLLPAGWKFSTSLPVASASANNITFKPVEFDLLIDSPVQSGQYMKVVQLTPGENPSHEIDIAADSPSALDLSPDLIENYRHLIREAQALYQSHHYREYHFLLTLSDNTMPLGQEHHESSDDRMGANGLSDPNRQLLAADLFPHEFTHSWNGQYRRPAGLATPNFQQPMLGDLLWVYEGMTDYLGAVLATRSGLLTRPPPKGSIGRPTTPCSTRRPRWATDQ